MKRVPAVMQADPASSLYSFFVWNFVVNVQKNRMMTAPHAAISPRKARALVCVRNSVEKDSFNNSMMTASYFESSSSKPGLLWKDDFMLWIGPRRPRFSWT